MKKRLQFISKFTLLLFLWAAMVSYAFADEIKFDDNWGKQGYNLVDQKSESLEIVYSVNSFSLFDQTINNEEMQGILLPGNFLPNDEGAPDLPGSGRFIAIPQNATASLEILEIRTETYQNINLAPAPRIPLDTEDGPMHYEKNQKIFSRDAFYPAEPVKLSPPTQIRGMDAVTLGVTPFQYNPVTKELIVIRDIRVRINFEGGNGHFGDDRLRSRWWDPIFSDMFLNHESIPEIDYSKRMEGANRDEGCEYLIITANAPEYQQWADSIRKFRTNQGILTMVVTIDEVGGNNVNTIENYLNTAFGWDIPPVACLLIGDYGNDADYNILSPIWDGYCVSDNIYGDVSGNDMPDIVMARMTANNEAQLEVMVTKFLDYERMPPTNPDFYNHPITALGWQTERWFQICSETVGGFWREVQGKDPLRVNAIYSGTPSTTWSTATNTGIVVDYFGPNGLGYIPATPAELGGWTGGNATMVNNGINDGCFMLQHRDHGYEQGWGEPDYSSSDINGLHNEDLVFVWSINCLTGKYNLGSECFAEKFHRYTYNGENSGALAINAASEVSYSFVNDTYVWGAYDNMWPDFMPDYGTTPEARGVWPAFACAAGKYFLQQSAWPYNTNNKEVTYNLFHHHGDAFTTVYSEVPQELDVNHDPIVIAGATTFNISANENALIALTVNGEIIAVEEGTGSVLTVNIPGQFPPDQVLVTVTLQNYYRYEALLDVIPPSGPYVGFTNYEIDDEEGGNNDGLMDYAETNLLNLTVENFGNEEASDVILTLTTDDPYVTITDGTENYGNVAAGGSLTVDGGFSYDVAGNIPDGHSVSFDLEVAFSGDSYMTGFSITGHAPALEYVDYIIDDASGNNNGKVDPGETVNLEITVHNDGSSEAFNVFGEVLSADPFVTINSDEVSYGDLAGDEDATATFSITASVNTPQGHYATFDFDMFADYDVSATGEFSIVIGQVPVLILDLDPNNSSGTEMATVLDDIGVGYDYETAFPADLNLYSSIFCCLGIYSTNHTLSSGEGSDLADYLNQGGRLYMEGGDTWAFDSQTAVHAMFNINGTDDGSSDMGTVNGQSGTFTEGMSFNYSGENNWMDHLSPIGSAFEILENQSPNYGTAIAYDAGDYKTIGASHEFGGLDDASSPSTKYDLMVEYLEFFGINSSLAAMFSANTVEVCEGGEVEFVDLSTGDVVSWEWTFEGGTPGTSNEENPVVTYNTAGVYDVTLVVSDGGENSTLLAENFITVLAGPDIPETPAGPEMVCINTLSTDYTVSEVPGANEYDWVLTPETAGTISGTGTSISIVWAGEEGECELKVASINDCGMSEYSTALMITCYGAPDVPEMPSGPEMVCFNAESSDYSVSAVSGATDYSWMIEPETAGTLTVDGNNVAVMWDMAFYGNVTISVSAANDCESSAYSDALSVERYLLEASLELTVDTICQTSDPVMLNGGEPIGGEYSGTGVYLEGGDYYFDPAVAGTGDHEITYSYTDEYNCGPVTATDMMHVSECAGLQEFNTDTDVSIFPNPTAGNFNISLNVNTGEVFEIVIVNAMNEIIYHEVNISAAQMQNKAVELNDKSAGVYFVRISSKDVYVMKKVVLNK